VKRSRIIGGVLAAAALVAGVAVMLPAHASSGANKPFAAASLGVRQGPGVFPLLTATMQNSKPTDIVLLVSMECSIITDAVIPGSNMPGTQQSATTSGKVRAWIEIDGKIVPIVSSSAPPQNPPPPGTDADKVTFCNRVFNRTVVDKEGPAGDGIDGSRDYIETKDANAFNWVRLNVGSGPHTIKLWGEFTSAASAGGSSASAYVGRRSMIGIPDKFANNAVIDETATG
jgi:hypothetical protein